MTSRASLPPKWIRLTSEYTEDSLSPVIFMYIRPTPALYSMDRKWCEILKITDIKIDRRKVDDKLRKSIEMDVQRDSDDFDKSSVVEVLKMYCATFPCDGYCQGMHFMAKAMVSVMGDVDRATWGLIKVVSEVRLLMPSTSEEKWKDFYDKWEGWYTTFSGYVADDEHVMALKWGVFRMGPSAGVDDLILLWDAMFQYPPELRGVFTAAVAAAVMRRENIVHYDPRMAVKLRFNNASGLVKTAKRIMRLYKAMYI